MKRHSRERDHRTLKVDPVDALKLYYKGVDPKRAAASQLKESVHLDEQTRHRTCQGENEQGFRKLESMITLMSYEESDYSDGKARFYFDAKKHDGAERRR